MPAINSIGKPKIFAVVAYVLPNTQNLVISRCCLAENGNEMYKDLQRTCTAIVLLIKPFVKQRSRRRCRRGLLKGTGKRGHIVADTLLPTQMFPRLPARATFVADTNFVSGTQKMFLILFRNILCPQQMFPSLRAQRNIMSNNVSATMCPRLPVP